MTKKKIEKEHLENNEIRKIMLQYFYNRNKNATSSKGKKGSAIKISDIKKELKESNNLSQQEVQSNLTYLISQGWVQEENVQKTFSTNRGTFIPSTTNFYQITAAGIDKIEGPGEFTMQKFQGIKIEATGQNIITVGDGNKVNATFGELGNALADLHREIINSDASESQKMELIADIDTIQSQLSKPTPSKTIIKTAWESVKAAASIGGCAALIAKITGLISGLI